MLRNYNIIKFLLFAYAILFLYSLIYRLPHVDDSWLGEHAYWQSKLGYVKSELMHGLSFQEIRFLCHHKLFTLQGALLINCFGFSLYVLKSLSLIYLAIFLVLFYLYCFKNKPYQNLFTLFILLLITFEFVFDLSFVYRPEISTMTIGFISYIFLDKAFLKQHNNLLFIIGSGLFAGLAAANHLNGLIFPIAGFLILLLNKKYRYALLFGISVLATFSIYFYDFTSEYNFKWWSFQFNETPSHDRLHKLPYGLYYLNNFIKEHMRYFHCPKEIFLSTFLICLFLVSYKYLKEYKILINYTLLLMLGLAVIAIHKEPRYMIPYLPYLFLLSIISIYKIQINGVIDLPLFKRFPFIKIKGFLVLLFSLYFITNSYYNIQSCTSKLDPDFNRTLVKKYLPNQTLDCNVLAPLSFIFNEINNFHMIQSSFCYDQMQLLGINVQKENLLIKADDFGIDYIILNKPFIRVFQMDKLAIQDFNKYNYEVLVNTEELLLLKKHYAITH